MTCAGIVGTGWAGEMLGACTTVLGVKGKTRQTRFGSIGQGMGVPKAGLKSATRQLEGNKENVRIGNSQPRAKPGMVKEFGRVSH